MKSFLLLGFVSLSVFLGGCNKPSQFLQKVPPPVIVKKVTINTIHGFVGNALNGAAIAGVCVQLMNLITGVVASAVETDSSGRYRMELVPEGNYSMVFGRAGFTDYTTLQPGVLGNGQLVRVDASLSPTLLSGQFRIVLTWTGEKPDAVRDVDSYLLIPGFPTTPIFYSKKTFAEAGANLDRDDTDWQGPETITIDRTYAGAYRYYIVNYNTPHSLFALGNSNAIVTVYGATGLLKQYRLNPGGQGDVYEFFTIENGMIHDVERYNSSLPHSN